MRTGDIGVVGRTLLCSGILPAMLLVAVPSRAADAPAFPIRPSADGCCLVDAKQRPFLYHADTAWAITKRASRQEYEQYFDNLVAAGFTAVQIHAFSKEVGPVANRAGDIPFQNDDLLKPVEAYWRNVDAILVAAEKRGILVAMSAVWLRSGGADKQGWRYQLTDENARPYGRFLGARYGRFQNLMWVLGGDANPAERSHAIGELASGIREAAPHHLLTVHNAPSFSSAAFFEAAPWLDLNMAYSYQEIHRHVIGEYARLGKKRPIILGESGYEEENNDSRGGTPWRMRRQAWEALLSGALGGQAYGHRLLWQFAPEWRSALDAPGRQQMRHVRALAESIGWQRLVPDTFDHLVTRRGHFGEVGYVSAAVTPDGSLAVLYFPEHREVHLELGRLKPQMRARWYDPATGSFQPAELRSSMNPPARNAAGESDWVLVLDDAGASRHASPSRSN